MGQYYKTIILSDSVPEKEKQEIIRLALSGYEYHNGSKLMEHSWLNNPFVAIIEWLISPKGMFYKSRLVWAGDYANTESNVDQNLYHIAATYHKQNTYPHMKLPNDFNTNTYRYIVNYTKCEYVDKERVKADSKLNAKTDSNRDYNKDNECVVHPLPLLVAEGNGYNSGDYHGHNKDLCGIWARDVISVETDVPDGFTERVCDFRE